MKLEDIKTELKGYFIHRQDHIRTLAVKQDKDFKLITDNIPYQTIDNTKYELTPTRYLLMQINNQLLDPTARIEDLSDILEVIDFNIFDDYDTREIEIDRHKRILDKIQNSKSIFGRKKDFKLIYTESKGIIGNGERKYYVIKSGDVVPIDSALLDSTDNAIEVTDIEDVKQALADDFINLYSEKYNAECRKWDSLN